MSMEVRDFAFKIIAQEIKELHQKIDTISQTQLEKSPNFL